MGGVNKALLEIGSRPIIDRILAVLRPLVDEVVVMTNDDALARLSDVRLVYDEFPYEGVLPALAAGLAAAHGDVCLTAACDMPFVSRTLYERCLALQRDEDADVVIPRSTNWFEPMHAVYRRLAVLAAIEASLTSGERRMTGYFSRLRVREVGAAETRAMGVDPRAFHNVNTPADLVEARRLAETEEPTR